MTTPSQTNPLNGLIEAGPLWRFGADRTVPFLIPNILVAGGLGMVAGEPKTGKSWLAFDLALSVANDVPFLGEFRPRHSGRVLYIANEGSRHGARARIDALARGKSLDPMSALTSVDVIWRKRANLDEASFQRALQQAAPLYVLVIVDVLKKAWSGDENSNREVSRLLRGVEEITRHGPTVVLVHHFAKQSDGTASRRTGQRIIGATALHAAVDSGIYLVRAKDGKRTHVEIEQKDSAPARPFSFAWPNSDVDGSAPITLDYQPICQETETQNVARRIVESLSNTPGQTRTDLQRTLKKRRETINRAVDHLIANYSIQIRRNQLFLSDQAGLSDLSQLSRKGDSAQPFPKSPNPP